MERKVRLRVLSPLVRLTGEEMEVPATTTVTNLKTILLARLEGQPTVKVGSVTELLLSNAMQCNEMQCNAMRCNAMQ